MGIDRYLNNSKRSSSNPDVYSIHHDDLITLSCSSRVIFYWQTRWGECKYFSVIIHLVRTKRGGHGLWTIHPHELQSLAESAHDEPCSWPLMKCTERFTFFYQHGALSN